MSIFRSQTATSWLKASGRHHQDPKQLNIAALMDATDGFSGAELEQIIITTLYSALYLEQPLDTALLLKEIKQTIPLSVSRKEHLQQLRAIAKARFVSVHLAPDQV
jgi:hypothetical protein